MRFYDQGYKDGLRDNTYEEPFPESWKKECLEYRRGYADAIDSLIPESVFLERTIP